MEGDNIVPCVRTFLRTMTTTMTRRLTVSHLHDTRPAVHYTTTGTLSVVDVRLHKNASRSGPCDCTSLRPIIRTSQMHRIHRSGTLESPKESRFDQDLLQNLRSIGPTEPCGLTSTEDGGLTSDGSCRLLSPPHGGETRDEYSNGLYTFRLRYGCHCQFDSSVSAGKKKITNSRNIRFREDTTRRRC